MSGQYGGGPYESPSYAARSAEAHARSGGGVGGGGSSYGGDSYSVASSSYAPSSRQGVPQQQYGQQQQHQQYGYQPQQQYGQQQYGQQKYGQQQSSSAAMAEQQSRLLSSACQHIKQESYYMKRAMESGAATTTIGHGPQSETSAVEGALSAVLDRAVSMLSELCTSDLTPKNYYEMHMKILDQMQLVEDYLLDLSSVSDAVVTMEDLYQTVQYCPKVVPRSYLQIAAGSALIKSNIASAGAGEDGPSPAPQPQDASPSSSDFSSTYAVLDDLIESVRAVQCPLRGLFLRHYLMQATRDKLPDVGSPYGTDTAKSCDFVLRNFEEMNKLWVRIQHMHAANKQQRKKRERERNELRILVGTNLVRLSQLEGVSTPVYKDVLLPRILNQVLECKDTLAQAYLMDCIIQVFPDEFHLETLQQLLAVCPRLKEKVNVQNILQSIMDRLAHYERSSSTSANDKDNADNDVSNDSNNDDDDDVADIVTKFDAFQLFDDCIRSVHAAREGKNRSRLDETLRLQSALLAFSLNCYPANLANVDRCLEACATALAKEVAADPRKVRDDATLSKELEKLLSVALDALALRVLDLGGDRFTDLLSHLPWENRRRVATVLLRAVFGDVDDARRRLADVERVERLLAMIAPLLRDEPGAPPTAADEVGEDAVEDGDGGGGSAELARERRALVARLVHLLHHDDTDVLFKMYALARKSFAHGGRGRVRYTMLPLVYAALPLVHRVHRLEFPPPLPPTPDSDADADADADVNANADADVNADVDADGISQSKEEGGENSEVKEGVDVETKQDGSAATPAAQADKSSDENESKVADKDDVVSGEVDDVDTPSTAGRQENGKSNGTEAPPSGTELQGVDLMGDGRKAGRLGESTPLLPAFDKTVNCRRVLLFLQKIVSSVATNFPELGFKLYLEVALAIDRCATLTAKSKAESGGAPSDVPSRGGGGDFPAMAYEFMSQAFILYEDDISDSKAQYRSIVAMVGTLLACRGFEKEDYEALITKTTQYGAKLLKKPDQCRMVTLCSHLFFTGDQNDPDAYRNPQRVLECLQRALKIADVCMASSANVALFVEILDHYVFYFERENPVITDKYVSGLIALINEHIDGMRDFSDTSVQAQAHYRQILQHIARKKNAKETAERFSSIVC